MSMLQGNTHAKRSTQGDEPVEGTDSFRVGSPPLSPRSPLTYSPQVPMEPIAHAHVRHEHDSSAQRLGTEFVGAAGWPAQPKLVPVEISCKRAAAGCAVAAPAVAQAVRATGRAMIHGSPAVFAAGFFSLDSHLSARLLPAERNHHVC
jgi:hypothetical protein